MTLSQRMGRLLERLTSSRSRAREGLVLVEGVRGVGEVLAAGVELRFACVAPRLDGTHSGRSLRARLERRSEDDDFELFELSDAEMARVADTEHPQGVVAVCPEPAAELDRSLVGARRVLVLDGIQDPGNVGTLIRSAVAFGFDPVLALDGTTDPWGAKAVRASAGLAFRTNIVRCDADAALSALSAHGITLFVADAEGRIGVALPPAALALALGNEGGGTRASVLAAAAQLVAIAMPGPAESLNVGVAGSILMSDFCDPSVTLAAETGPAS